MKLTSKISWPSRFLIGLCALALFLYLAAVALLNTAWSQRVLTRYLVSRIGQITEARVEIAQLHIHPAAFRLVLCGLVLHGHEVPTQEPLLSARTLDVTLNPVLLLSRKLVIERVDAIGVNVHLYTAADGSNNLPTPRLGAAGQNRNLLKDLVNLQIGNFSLIQSNLYWNDQQIPLDITAKNLALLLGPGKGASYSGSLSTSSLQLESAGRHFPFATLATRVRISSRQIALENLVWRTEAGAGTGSLSLNLDGSTHVNFALRGKANLEELRGALGITFVRSGGVIFSGRGAYFQGSLEASGGFEGRDLLVNLTDFNPGLADLSGHFQIQGPRLNLTQIKAQLLGGEATGKAVVEWAGAVPRLNFQGDIQHIGLAAFIHAIPGGKKAWNLFGVDSQISGKLGLAYNQKPGEFRGEFDVQGAAGAVHPVGLRPLTGVAQGALTLGQKFQLALANVDAQMPHSELQAQGLLATQDSNLKFQYETSDFEESRKFIEFLEAPRQPIPLVLKSKADFSGRILGPVVQPELQGRIHSGPFQYAGYPWRAFAGAVTLSPQFARISDGLLAAGRSAFTFNLQTSLVDWQVTAASQIRASAQARNSPLEGLQEAIGFSYPLSGVLNGKVSFEGTPANLSGQGLMEIRKAEFAGEPIDLLRAQASVVNSVVDIAQIEMHKGKGKLQGGGRLDLVHKTFAGHLDGSISLAEFRKLVPPSYWQAERSTVRSLGGVAELHLQGQGTMTRPEVSASADIPDFSVGGAPAGYLILTLRTHARMARFSAKLTGPEGDATLNATAAMTGDWPGQFSGQIDKLRVDTGIAWFEDAASKAQISASGSFNGRGQFRKPSTLVMEGIFQEVAASLGGFDCKNSHPVHLTYAGQRITADPFQLSGPSTNIQIEGSLRLVHPVELNLKVSGHSEAALLTVFYPSIQAAGTFDAQLTARGTLANPEYSGTIQVKDLGLGYANFPFQLASLNGRIELEGNHANLVDLGSVSGQSSIQMKGFVSFGEHARYDLRARLKRARLGFPADFTSLLSGSLELSGTESGGQLSGHLSVTQMFAKAGFNLLSWLGKVGSPSPPVPSLTSPLASRIRLSIDLTTSPDVSLESHDLAFVAVIDANIQGTVANPVVLGTIHMRSGYAMLRGNRYNINRGDITMSNPVRTQPVLDLEATTRVEHYDLTMDVTGPLDRAKIAYRSDPPLPTEDILSLLALGYAPQLQQLNAGGAQPTAAVGASAILSQALSSQFSGRVQKLLGVSRIQIDPNLIGPTTAGGARVTIEEQVGHNVTLTYATNTGAAQQRDIRLEWDLSDRISVIGERDINGVYGFELRFRRRFK
jgi:translocation and assembly module TamB